MPFSSGSYSLPALNPVVTATAISSTWANNTLSDIATALSTCLLKDGTQTATANIPLAGFKFTGLGAGSAAGNSVRWEQTGPGVLTTTGDIMYASSANTPARLAIGAADLPLVVNAGATAPQWGYATKTINTVYAGPSTGSAAAPAFRVLTGFDLPLRSYLAGLTLSTAGASTTMTIAAGQTTDGGNTQGMTLASSIAKTTSSWAVGNAQGGLDTGAIANSTWYHFWLIMRPDTGVVDVLMSLSATAPTMPANYTLKRRIGSGFTTAGGNWTAFVQDGDLFQWLVPVNNVNTTNPGASAILATTTIPTGITAPAYLSTLLVNGTTTSLALFLSDPAITDSAADTSSFFSLVGPTAAAGQTQAGEFYIRTNTSAQIRYRLSASGANDIVRIATKGWVDHRGRDS